MSYKLVNLTPESKGFRDNGETYWNNEKAESEKAFNVEKFGLDIIEKTPRYIALYNQLDGIDRQINSSLARGKILSIASGTCWLEAKWLRTRSFEKLVCVDFSRHRIHKLAPKTLEMYGLSGNITLCCGSVFDLEPEDDERFDVILLSQAFHHIEEPIRLLRLIRDILSPSGMVVIVGEPFFGMRTYFRRVIKHFIKYTINWRGYRRLSAPFPGWQDLFPPDYNKGDIHYSLSDYEFLFRKSGFLNYKHSVDKTRQYQAFHLWKDKQ